MASGTGGSYKTITFDDFSGGHNLQDGEVAENESPDCWNVTINRQGAVEKRLGYAKWNTEGQPSDPFSSGYYSQLLGKQILQSGQDLYLENGNGAIGSSTHTFSTDAVAAFVDFTTFVYAIHPIDGMIRTADGTTWNDVAAGPAGTTIDVWQNKLWAGGDPSAGDTLSWSAPGDGSDWTGDGSGTNAIRQKDSAPITAVRASPREGLVVYKDESCYRVFDATGGAYQALDLNFGAANHYAVTLMFGLLYACCKHGVFVTDGITKPVEISQKLNRLFKRDILNFGKTAIWRAGFLDPKVYFSITTAGQTANDLALEYDTRFNCWVPHSCAAAAYLQYSPSDDERLLGASPTVDGQLYDLYSAVGSDDEAAIASRFQTALFKPERLGLCRFRQATLRGVGAFDFYTKLDGAGDTNDSWMVEFDQPDTGLWDTAKWDQFSWGPSNVIGTDRIYSLGCARDISFEIRQSGTGTNATLAMLDTLASPTEGFWSLYSIKMDYVTLGLA